MRIINIVPDVLPVRMGVWLPGVNVADALLKNHNVKTEIWFPGDDYNQNFYSATPVNLKNTSPDYLNELIKERNLNPATDIIVSNSPWSFQHKWGYHLAQKGFAWVCMPHGNFQAWGLAQKWWKKKPYFYLVLKPMLKKAAMIRASGILELQDMQKIMPHFPMQQIPNGVPVVKDYDGKKENASHKIFFFMGRLNFKKRIVELVQAWLSSSLNNNDTFSFVIAGPDDGDLDKIKPLIAQSKNIQYIGAVYGDDKENWLRKSSFFILPSILEGFTTSALEAGARACIPIISEGCNFPEIINAGAGLHTGIEKTEIVEALEHAASLSNDEVNKLAMSAKKFIEENYSMDVIAKRIFEAYRTLLPKQ